MEYEINAIDKPFHALGHEAITAVGNLTEGWSISAKSAIRRLELRREKFFVIDPMTGEKVYVTLASNREGRKWLRTFHEGRPTNHLMALRPLRDCALID